MVSAPPFLALCSPTPRKLNVPSAAPRERRPFASCQLLEPWGPGVCAGAAGAGAGAGWPRLRCAVHERGRRPSCRARPVGFHGLGLVWYRYLQLRMDSKGVLAAYPPR